MHPSPSLVRCSPCGALGRWRGDRSEESRLVVSTPPAAGPRGPGATAEVAIAPAVHSLPSRPMFPDAAYSGRLDRARALMSERGADVMLLSVGSDLPYFIAYEA